MLKWVALVIAAIAIIIGIGFLGTVPAQRESPGSSSEVNAMKSWNKPPEMVIETNKTYTASLKTDKGTIKFNLLANEAPKTVNNFVFLTREKYYDGVVFHRIIKDFMVQTGDPTGTGGGGPGYQFENEPVNRAYSRGIVAMANAGLNTNGSQFFIIHKDYNLPKQYTVFGVIDLTDTESLTTLDTIAATPVTAGAQGEASKPTETVKILSATIEEK